MTRSRLSLRVFFPRVFALDVRVYEQETETVADGIAVADVFDGVTACVEGLATAERGQQATRSTS